PSQQLASMSGDDVRQLVDGATYLFTNEYETQLMMQSTGWSRDEILSRVGQWVMTHGADGVHVMSEGRDTISVPAAPVKELRDPTGVGDAFRAGVLWGVHQDLNVERACETGATIGSVVLETVGNQEYDLRPRDLSAPIARCYGEPAAAGLCAKRREEPAQQKAEQ